MRHGRRLSAALSWAVLTILVILYWRRSDDSRQGKHYPHTIPSRKIWQITGDNKVQPARDCAQPWITSNPGWSHTMHTDETATAFAARHWSDDDDDDKHLARALGELRNIGIRADLIRYLLLGAEGGVYTDLDTVPLRPIDEWLSWGDYLDRGVRLVVGVEWDEPATAASVTNPEEPNGGTRPKGVLHEVQFCQWTIIATAAGHPVFEAMIGRALAQLAEHRSFWGAQSLREVVFSEQEVLSITGPAAWTEVVRAHMQIVDPAGLGELRELSGLKGPRLVGDVLVLPVDAFASGMSHSGATREEDGVPDIAMAKHLFRGSWREGQKGKPLC